MDFLNEGIALGVDLLILGFCVREYVNHKQHLQFLKAAPHLAIDGMLKSHLASLPGKKINYAVIRGTVEPIGLPIRSVLSPGVAGVVQVIKLGEHRMCRSFAGFWVEQSNLVRITSNETPFKLRGSGDAVEVINPFSASLLDLDVVYNYSEPCKSSFLENFLEFLSGVRQKDLQTTEEMLRVNTVITGIGELELDGDALRLQPSTVGPLLLTASTKETVMQKFECAKSSYMTRIIVCGIVGTVIMGFIARKFYLRRKQKREDRQMKETLEKERRRRRALSRPQNLTSEQLCVVCSTNPKEIIILPCGHVCLCEDCAERIQTNCPVCRGEISKKSPAFIT